jgi:hypothetical protein
VQYTTETPSVYSPTTKHVTAETESSVQYTTETPSVYSPTTKHVTAETESSVQYTTETPSVYSPTTKHVTAETESSVQYKTETPSVYSPTTRHVTAETESSVQYTTETPSVYSPTTEHVTEEREPSMQYTTGTPILYSPTTKHMAGETESSVQYTTETPTVYGPTARHVTAETESGVQYTTLRAPKATEVTETQFPYSFPTSSVSATKESTVHIPVSSSISSVFSKAVELSTSPTFIPESSSFAAVPSGMTSTNISQLGVTAEPKVTLVMEPSKTSQTKPFSVLPTFRPLETCISELDCSYDTTCICHKCLDPCVFYNPCAMGVRCVVRSHRPVCLCAKSENLTAASVECRTLPGKHKTPSPFERKAVNETHLTWEIYKTSIQLCTCNICLAILH